MVIDLHLFCSADCGPDSWMARHLQRIGEVDKYALFYFQRRNEMLGLGLLGTIIVIVVIVWLVRMV
jgi:hypothetical protein